MKNIFSYTILFFLILLTSSMKAQWFLQNSPSQNYDLLDIFALNQDTAIAVGYNSLTYEGMIIKTTDAGENWLSIPYDSTHVFSSVYFLNADTGWTVGSGYYGVSLNTTDAGQSWTWDTVGYGGLRSVYFSDANNGWTVGGFYDGLEHDPVMYNTNDGGVNWYFQYPFYYEGELSSVYFVNKDTGFIAGWSDGGSIFKTTDRGLDWEAELDTGDLFSIFFNDEFTGWATGRKWNGISYQGVIFKTTDGGDTWVNQQIGVVNYLNAIYFANENTGWAVGLGGIILHTSDGGKYWFNQASGTNNVLNSVHFIDENTGWAVGENGTILRTNDGGGTVPVELTSFTATATGSIVLLHWSTATELNNQGFEIQRSNEDNKFVTIGFVNGNGTSTEQHNYTYTDKNLNSGKYYYRLKQKDFNGSYEYSKTVDITVSPNKFSLEQNYPDPFNPTTTIKYSIPNDGMVSLKVYDILGEEVMTLVNKHQRTGEYTVELNGANLSSGVYIYRLEAGTYNSSKKMILLK